MPKADSGITLRGTVCTFFKVGTCSEALCNVLNRAFDFPLIPEEHASMPFAGGIMKHGYQCGLIWGATLAAGAQAYRLPGPGPQSEAMAIIAAQRLVDSFRTRNQAINCRDLTGTDWQKSRQVLRFFLKGGILRYLRKSAKYAPAALREINTALAEKDIEVPSPPVSCVTMLAQKLGLSEQHFW